MNDFFKKLLFIPQDEPQKSEHEKAEAARPFFTSIDEAVNAVTDTLRNSPDILVRRISNGGVDYAIIFSEVLVDKNEFQRSILTPLLTADTSLPLSSRHAGADTKPANDIDKAVALLLYGSVIIISTNPLDINAVELKKTPKASGNESSPENIILGPHERFGNTIKGNLSLLRLKIKNPSLCFTEYNVGTQTNTTLMLAHINGIASESVVENAKKMLNGVIKKKPKSATEFVTFFKDTTLSPFPQYVTTERPDRTSSHILGGGVAVFIDGSPWAILAPVSFSDFLKSPEDHNTSWIYASIIRVLRWISVIITIFAPAFYVAVMSFHPGLFPSKFMLLAASGRASVPFPAVVEVVIMEIFIELLREASISMPSNIGSTISIVGGIIIGETAIVAGLASPLLVIIIAISAITSFTIPVYTMVISLRVVRFFVLFLASFFGFFGLIIAMIMIFTHLVSLKSLGKNYLFPLAPMRPKRWGRDILQLPQRWL